MSLGRYTIEKCKKSDIREAMAFFGAEHNSSHLLASSEKFVNLQYFNPETERYNILIAKDDGILGILAYVTNTFYDKSIPQGHKFIWLCNWLAKKDYKGFVGIDLLMQLPKLEGTDKIGNLGLTAAVKAFSKKSGYSVGRLEQYFFVNRNIDKFKILRGQISASRARSESSSLTRIDSMSGISTDTPYKSPEFFENKYMRSPFYKYFAYSLENGGGILFGRRLTHNATNVVRLVEYAGHEKYLSGLNPQHILDEHDAEYLDFYCAGISPSVLYDAGFSLNSGQLIVPNYFEPFVDANIEIEYAYTLPGCRIFKGDGDREHPRAL